MKQSSQHSGSEQHADDKKSAFSKTILRSFDAVGHMVASGLGIAALPKGAALPIARAMKLQWRPLADAWAVRQLQVAIRPDADATVVALRDFLLPTSQTAKSGRTKLK